MKLLESYSKVKLIVNQTEIRCHTCRTNRFNTKVIKVGIENGYTELHTECTCCGKIEIYNYRIAKNIIHIVKEIDKTSLLKKVFDYYEYEYEICDNGSVKEFNDEGGYNLYNSIDEALKEWVGTMQETNKNFFKTGNIEEKYNTWSKEEIDFIKLIN